MNIKAGNIKAGLFMLLQFLPVTLFAVQDGVQGEVELSIEKDTDFWISQKVKLTLKVKTDAFSMQNLTVDTQHNKDFIIIKPESAAYNGSEESEDGETSWQYNVYEYFVYPMHSGEITIKPFRVEFSASMGYGQPRQTFNLQTQAISFSVARPKGLGDKQFALSTPSLSANVSYSPDVEELKVGDALERKIVITAVDVPDVLLPPVPGYQTDADGEDSGFKVYRREPVLSETVNGVQLTSTRIEHDTFIATSGAAGSIIMFPEIKMYWWHPDKQVLHTETIPAKKISIVENPLLIKETLGQQSAIRWMSLIKENFYWVLPVFLLALLLLLWWVPLRLKKHNKKKALFEKSVEGYFKRFRQACFSGSTQDVYKAFYGWAKLAMPEVSPLNFRQIVVPYPELKDSLSALELSLVKKEGLFDVRVFYQRVSNIHKQLQSQQAALTRNDLPASLNPVHSAAIIKNV